MIMLSSPPRKANSWKTWYDKKVKSANEKIDGWFGYKPSAENDPDNRDGEVKSKRILQLEKQLAKEESAHGYIFTSRGW